MPAAMASGVTGCWPNSKKKGVSPVVRTTLSL